MKKVINIKRAILISCLTICLFYLFLNFDSSIYHWQWQRALRFFLTYQSGEWILGPLWDGLCLSLHIVSISFFLAILLGLIIVTLRFMPSYVSQILSKSCIGLIRNTPLLIQLFMFYFALAPIFDFSPFWVAVWSLAIFEGAYMAEIFRAGINSIEKIQWDAGYALGFSNFQICIYILFPQVLRRILPPLTNQCISLIKDSALVSAIALPELTMQAQLIIADTFLSLELWIIVAILYILLSLIVTIPSKALEHYYKWKWI